MFLAYFFINVYAVSLEVKQQDIKTYVQCLGWQIQNLLTI